MRPSFVLLPVLVLFVLLSLPAEAAAARPTSAPVARPVHTLTDATLLDARFAGVLETGVEYRAVIEMENGKKIEIVFFPETAPNHVANFVSLARNGYYNGITFHRVIPGFMAQGGDPTGTGAGGPGYTIKAEFSATKHVRGTVSMARTPDPNSAGSQFFICFGPQAFLDGQYTVFGIVEKGMDVVDAFTPRDPQRATAPGDAMKTVTIVEVRDAPAPPPARAPRTRNRSNRSR